MNTILKTAMAVAGLLMATNAMAQVSFYENENFQGSSFTTEKQVDHFKRFGFNDRASSAIVLNERWEACENDRFAGRCVVLRPGRYPSLAALGLNDRISSARIIGRDALIDEHRYAPQPIAVYDNHRRKNERLYQADVISVRAVGGPPEQRCWTEHQQIAAPERSNPSVPGALVGAVIGGILGHQVGGGRGRDVATVGGAVAGGVIGAKTGRSNDDPQMTTRDVQRCETTASQGKPEYWDVTYSFRGQEHRIQMTSPPGASVTVNEQGEPRA